VLGVSFDTVERNRAFADKFGYPFKLLCDVDKQLGTAYRALDPDDPDYPRRISYLIGPDRRIVQAYEPVVPATHPDQVLADIS
jgi:peroxiredoxin Q/BCP